MVGSGGSSLNGASTSCGPVLPCVIMLLVLDDVIATSSAAVTGTVVTAGVVDVVVVKTTESAGCDSEPCGNKDLFKIFNMTQHQILS